MIRTMSSRRRFSTAALSLMILTCSASTFADLQAGASKVSITPDPSAIPYQLGGYVAPQRTGHNATGIHDACYARALVLANGRTKCAIVSLDLCYMPASVKEAVALRVAVTGIPASGLFLSATHTHSAPDPLALHAGNTGFAGSLPTFDAKLATFIEDRIAQAITEANKKLGPALAGSGQAEKLGLNRNRRGEKVTDDTMTAVKVTDLDGKPVASIFNYAAHPVYYGPEMMHASGDWSGTFERQMEAVYPGMVALFLNGAEGDASPNGADEGTPAEKIDTYSAKICAAARRLYDGIHAGATDVLRAWTHDLIIGPPKPHPFFLLGAGQLHATSDQARELVNRLMPTTCEISFARIADALLIGVPCEPTAAIGLEAKSIASAAGAKNVGVVALTNGWLGYMLKPEQYRTGKYEATMSFYGDQGGEMILAGIKAGISGK